jgi:hypothetical protein
MANLSPSAQAVSDAFFRYSLGKEPSFVTDRGAIAAALRAAADQVASLPPPSNSGDPEMLKGIWDERRTIRAKLLAIANELN